MAGMQKPRKRNKPILRKTAQLLPKTAVEKLLKLRIAMEKRARIKRKKKTGRKEWMRKEETTRVAIGN